ncbi:TetR/AcrR family transcriptional regulator [Primorskyibacter sp. S87]|uniref:TetR/AcrR family transcriptional regulator n=1 Tax=Primorskyibacter sp. S87 TaxID=3415126 RepID=UPI003C7ED971
MQKTIQKRTLKTRARLLSESHILVRKHGYEALRVEEVVRAAGVAKGTFFAHFKDKDALMEILIGEEFGRKFDEAAAAPSPGSVPELVAALDGIHSFMTSERYVFDLILRYSGATAIAEIGPIAHCFVRYVEIVAAWLETANLRRDVSAELLAEGVMAFAIQAMSLQFCALHGETNFAERLETYLTAWLRPAV